MKQVPQDIRLIGERELNCIPEVDLIIAGWECQGHSRAGKGKGLDDPRSQLFYELLRLLHLLRKRQGYVSYVLENVPSGDDHRSQVRSDFRRIEALIGAGVLVDAAAYGSRAHRLRVKWTNIADTGLMRAAVQRHKRPPNLWVDDILAKGRQAQIVQKADRSPFYACNEVGKRMAALPTLVSYPGSHAFRNGGPGMVKGDDGELQEPNAEERELAMGFRKGYTAALGLAEAHRRKLLGRAMDFNSLVGLIGTALVAQPQASEQMKGTQDLQVGGPSNQQRKEVAAGASAGAQDRYSNPGSKCISEEEGILL